MKRRVLRAHANKRSLRALSAEHALRLDTYHILCDASFLRAAALNGCGKSSTLHSLFSDTFRAAASVPETPSAGKEGIHISISYLPETAEALRRMAQTNPNPNPTDRKPNPSGRNKTRGLSTDVTEALLAGLRRLGTSNPTARNEAKAMAQFLAHPDATPTDGEKNAHFFFVATQSHDVRRRLPANAALLRLTHTPPAVWIERNAEAFHYTDETQTANPTRSAAKRRCGQRERGNAKGTGKAPSAADLAFMRHLSADAAPNAPHAKRRRIEETSVMRGGARLDHTATHAAKEEMGTETVEKGIRRETETVRVGRRVKGPRGPNPLSVKRKRTREVFRIDERKR